MKCFTVFEDGDYFIFGVQITWLNNIFRSENRTVRAMGLLVPALRLKVNKTGVAPFTKTLRLLFSSTKQYLALKLSRGLYS